ncbi:MAG: hypothetical protein AB1486_35035, partial [Planctomycetota bacterium]
MVRQRISFRGRQLGRAEIQRIRHAIADHPDESRLALYRRICQAWGWRRANGELRVHACRGLLRRLEEAGWIE